MASVVTKEDVERWTVEQVATWASDKGLSVAIVDFLRQQQIDGDQLLKVTKNDLVTICKMPLGFSGKLVDAINELLGEFLAIVSRF